MILEPRLFALSFLLFLLWCICETCIAAAFLKGMSRAGENGISSLEDGARLMVRQGQGLRSVWGLYYFHMDA